MSLKKLSADVRSLLQSSSHINSYIRAVEELVYNSLDSQAKSIAVRIDYQEGIIQVIDNGSGLTRPDMDRIGIKYMTGRCTSLSDIKSTSVFYGFRGVSLASLVDVAAFVTITSRHFKGSETWSKVFHNGKEKKNFETVPRPSKGTTVEIKGFLHNLEIQRKILNLNKEMHEIKVFLEHTALLHHGVSFTLRDDVKNVVTLKIPKRKNILQTMKSIYGLELSEMVQEIQVEKSPYKIKAYLGKKCLDDDDFQLIYLNGRRVLNSKLHAIVNLSLNSIFSIGKDRLNTKKHSNIVEDTKITKSNPLYILFIFCPYTTYDMSQRSNKTLVEFHSWTSINGIIKTLTNVFADSVRPKNIEENNPKVKVNHEETCPAIHQEKTNYITEEAQSQEIQDRVARIVDRILKSDPKKMHVQNGVKGKPAKRRNKKQLTKAHQFKSLLAADNKRRSTDSKFEREENNIANKQRKLINIENNFEIKNTANKEVSTHASNIVYPEFMQSIQKIINKKNSKTIMLKKNINGMIKKSKIKDKKLYEEIDNVFKNNHGSVKKRCNNLTQNVIKLMNKYDKNNRIRNKQISIHKTVHTSNVYDNDKHESIRKRSGEIVIHEFLQFPKSDNQRKYIEKRLYDYMKGNHKHHVTEPVIKSRYDLIKTVINSQNLLMNTKAKKIDINTRINKIHKQCDPETSYGFPKLTFNSHNYNESIVTPSHNHIYLQNHKCIMSNGTKINNHDKNQNDLIIDRTNIMTKSYIETLLPLKKAKRGNITVIAEIHKPITDTGSEALQGKNTNIMRLHETSKLSETYDIEGIQTTEYNFDDEINIEVPFSLSNTPIQLNDQDCPRVYNDINTGLLDNSNCNLNYSVTDIAFENVEQHKLNYTYLVEYSKMTSTKEHELNSANDIVNRIENQNMVSLTHFSDSQLNRYDSCDLRFYPKNLVDERNNQNSSNSGHSNNFQKITPNNVEVTFISKSYPGNDAENRFITPIEVCQAIIESGDLFEDSIDVCSIENSNCGCTPGNKTNQTGTINLDNEKHAGGIEAKNNIQSEDLFGDTADENLSNVELIDDLDKNSLTLIQEEIRSQQNTTNKYMNLDRNINDKGNVDQWAIQSTGKKIASDTAKSTNLVEATDKYGKSYFLHVNTGMTYKSNVLEDENNFNFKRRPHYVPKGFSPILQNGFDKNVTAMSQDYFTKSMYEDFLQNVDKCSELYEADVKNLIELLSTKDAEKTTNKYRKLNASIVFDGGCINHALLLDQIDNKFVAAVVDGKKCGVHISAKYLVLFDQHAVHERIRLERLMDEYKIGSKWRSTACEQFTLTVSDEELFYMENFQDKFTGVGLEWESCLLGDDNVVSVTALPLSLLGKNGRKMDVVIASVKALVTEQVKTLKCMHGASNTNPKTLMELINMEACRHAVKFGDHLTKETCHRLLQELARCQTPFQCAHGRPSMAVLISVRADPCDYKINIEKVKKFKY